MTAPGTLTVQAEDGRDLCVELAGASDGQRILVHGGSPNSRHMLGAWIDDAAARGVQLISYDRPGYGGSTPRPGHTVADGASDARAVLDALGIERAAVWGFSGGGPYTLACAALLPDRFAAAAIVGSVAPWDAPGLDFLSGMGKDNVDGIEKYLADPEAARAEGREERDKLIRIDADELKEAWQSLLSPIDAAVVTDAFAEWMVRGFHDGLGPSDQGWWDDGVAHMAPWGFALDSIRIPVKVWHGHHDQFVPVQHGIWLAEQIPGAEAVISETDGHLTLLATEIPSVHEWLLSHA